MIKATLSINGGKAHSLDEDGNLPPEGREELDRSLAKSIDKLKAGNSKPRPGGIAVDQLKSIIARVEKLEEEKAGVATDIRDVFAEAKGNGFDVPAIRQILRLRRMEPRERKEREAVLDTYLHALGMIQPDLFDDGEAA